MAQDKPAGIGKGDHLYLIDGSGFIFRAYHALPPLTRRSDGLPVGAVAGFCNMLHKMLTGFGTGGPTHLAVIFDYSGKSFRNEMYPEYKAHRPPAVAGDAPCGDFFCFGSFDDHAQDLRMGPRLGVTAD